MRKRVNPHARVGRSVSGCSSQHQLVHLQPLQPRLAHPNYRWWCPHQCELQAPVFYVGRWDIWEATAPRRVWHRLENSILYTRVQWEWVRMSSSPHIVLTVYLLVDIKNWTEKFWTEKFWKFVWSCMATVVQKDVEIAFCILAFATRLTDHKVFEVYWW